MSDLKIRNLLGQEKTLYPKLDYDTDYTRSKKKRKLDPEIEELYEQEFKSNPEVWSYFNPGSGELGKREIISRSSLYVPDKFKKYWKNKKDNEGEYIKLYGTYDIDGDDLPDNIAYDAAKHRVVGFNDKIVLPAGKSERPYRRDWAKIPPEERRALNQTYREWLQTQTSRVTEKWADTVPKEPTKFQSKVLLSIFKGFIENSELATYIKYAIIGRINTAVLYNIVNFDELIEVAKNEAEQMEKEEGKKYIKEKIEEVKLLEKLFRQTKLYKDHMKKVYNDVLPVIFKTDKNKLEFIQRAYKSLEEKGHKNKEALNDNMYTLLNEQPNAIYMNDEEAKEAIKEWQEDRAINKYLKEQKISRAKAYRADYGQRPKQVLAEYEANVRAPFEYSVKHPATKRKRDLTNAWKLNKMEEEVDLETDV